MSLLLLKRRIAEKQDVTAEIIRYCRDVDSGICWFCGDPLVKGEGRSAGHRRFCSTVCWKDWAN